MVRSTCSRPGYPYDMVTNPLSCFHARPTRPSAVGGTMSATQNVPSNSVHLEFIHGEVVCFAMEQAGIPILRDVRITNGGSVSLVDAEVIVAIEPQLGSEQRFRIPLLPAGEVHEITRLDLRLQPGALRNVIERERARLRVRLFSEGRCLAEDGRDIDVLPFNEWPGQRAPLGMLASFVTPNLAAVRALAAEIRSTLAAATDSSAIDGYQAGSKERVLVLVRAAFNAIETRCITYAEPPASFETTGQKIRLVDTIFADGVAACLDASLLLAAVLECSGLHALIVLLRGHALLAVWLVEDQFPEGIVEDSARLRTQMDLGQILVLDTTIGLSGGQIPNAFERSIAVGREALVDDSRFVAALDVKALRDDGFRPLSFRALDGRSGSLPDEFEAVDLDGARRLLAESSRESERRSRADAPTVVLSRAARRFQKWKEGLLDLTLRNKLLNFRTDRRGALPLDVPDIGHFEDLLARERQFEVLPKPRAEVDGRAPELVAARNAPPSIKERRLKDLAAGRLHCLLSPDDLSSRALFLERTARTDLEEGGASTLFVGIGFLRWFESSFSDEAKLAPLLLYPVSVRFDRQKRRTILARLEEDPAPNQTLIEKMRRDFKVDLAALGSPEDDESGINVSAMLRVVRRAIQQMPRWEVLEEAHLGHFKFSKFLMWKDLNDNEDQLLASRIVQQIADHEKANPISLPPKTTPDELDEKITPAELPCVLSADSTQMLAMHAALHSSGLILQGPPGTGKSQTITNFIAAVLARGHSVLFVSEKMAALEVVYRRLREVGLDGFCLELHSHKTTRKQVVESFGRALESPLPRSNRETWSQASEALVQLKLQLNHYVRALHAPTPLGLSVYEVIGRQHELADFPEVALPISDPLGLTAQMFKHVRSAVTDFAIRSRPVAPCFEHPWRWSSQAEWTSALNDELIRMSASLPEGLDELEEAATSLAATVGEPMPESTEAMQRLAERSRAVEHELEALCRETTAGPVPKHAFGAPTWPQLRTTVHEYTNRLRAQTRVLAGLSARWTDAFHHEELPSLAALFRRWKDAFVLMSWLFLWRARRRLRRVARAELPTNRQILEDLESAHASPREQDLLRRCEQTLSVDLADVWSTAASPDQLDATLARGERARAAWQRLCALPRGSVIAQNQPSWPGLLERLTAQRTRIERALQAVAADEQRFIELTRPTSRPWADPASAQHQRELKATALRMSREMGRFRDWCLYQRQAAAVVKLGLRGLVEAHGAGTLTPEQIEGSWERAVLSRWCKAAIDVQPALRHFSELAHDQLVKKFADDDAAHENLAREWIRDQLRAGVPREETARKDSELHLLRREVQKKSRHIAIRELLRRIPELRARLKPCFLMSPLSVAQYLPARAEFDFVVFDEASQIETHDAIGAIARGNQVIIVGDSKQLPPTRFFSRAAESEDVSRLEEDVVDLESILDEARARSVPEFTLGWHYRSRHDTLIAFSNKHYYDDRLQVFPAARNRVEDLGIAWHPVPEGVFYSSASRKNTRTNPEEARTLVAQLVRSLLRYQPAERTFGVVTFSLGQKELIDALLDQAREAEPKLEAHWASAEPVFVKNLENVQGDERDEILFSIAYARNEKGTLNHYLGPLSSQGGERRLNVAITRARRMLRVFSTLTHEQIELSRTKARGVEDLRAFLRFAQEHGSRESGADSVPVFDSALEREVHRTLMEAGYVVRTKIGCGAYRVDMAVEHPRRPGVYAIGIECDGPTYHSSRACRDRDRLRAEVLQDLSWRTHRVWSMAWQYGREREVEKLLGAVKAACAVPTEQPRPTSAPSALNLRTESLVARKAGMSESILQNAAPRVERGTGVRVAAGGSRPRGTPDDAASVRDVTPRNHLASVSMRSRTNTCAQDPELFAGYELLQPLRGGGMAECYRARNPNTGTIVFLKRVRVGSTHEGSLKRELDIYAKLMRADCGNILSILGQERDDEYVALVTEFADGGDLESHVRAQQLHCLPPSDCVRVALDVARGVVQLHELDIVHRDLKPANVLRSECIWKLADFGIAKDRKRAMPGATFQMAGSYGYAPPEQWAGTTADPSADVFALGKLIAFMATGGTDPDAIPHGYKVVRELALRCTVQAPQNRPSSTQLLQALEGLA